MKQTVILVSEHVWTTISPNTNPWARHHFARLTASIARVLLQRQNGHKVWTAEMESQANQPSSLTQHDWKIKHDLFNKNFQPKENIFDHSWLPSSHASPTTKRPSPQTGSQRSAVVFTSPEKESSHSTQRQMYLLRTVVMMATFPRRKRGKAVKADDHQKGMTNHQQNPQNHLIWSAPMAPLKPGNKTCRHFERTQTEINSWTKIKTLWCISRLGHTNPTRLNDTTGITSIARLQKERMTFEPFLKSSSNAWHLYKLYMFQKQN